MPTTMPEVEDETKQLFEKANLNSAFDWEKLPEKFFKHFKMASLDVKESLLDLSQMNITVDELHLIVFFLNAHPQIKSLELSDNKIDSEGAKILATNQTLEWLSIGHNNIGNEGAIALTNMKLKTLNVCENNIGNKGACGLALSTTIEILYLSVNLVGELGVKALTSNTKFRELSLGNNQFINKHDVARSFVHNNTLRKLQLYANGLDGISAMILSFNNSIRELDLADNEIDDMGALALSRMINLEDLNLSNNKIGDEGAAALVKKEFLNLDVEDNKNITEKGAFALLQKEQDRAHETELLWPAQKSVFLSGTKPGTASRVRSLPNDIITKILDFAAPRPFTLSDSFPEHIDSAFRAAHVQRISTRKSSREDEIETSEERIPKRLKPS